MKKTTKTTKPELETSVQLPHDWGENAITEQRAHLVSNKPTYRNYVEGNLVEIGVSGRGRGKQIVTDAGFQQKLRELLEYGEYLAKQIYF